MGYDQYMLLKSGVILDRLIGHLTICAYSISSAYVFVSVHLVPHTAMMSGVEVVVVVVVVAVVVLIVVPQSGALWV